MTESQLQQTIKVDEDLVQNDHESQKPLDMLITEKLLDMSKFTR